MLGARYREEQTLCLGERFALLRAQTPEGHRVVIKSVRADRADARSGEQLEREYELLSGLDVAGVVKPIAFEVRAGRPAMVLDDVGSRSVAELLTGGRLEVGLFLALSVQMAAILARIHAKNVIHRDICPANFVLDEAGSVTLIDFGIATRAAGLAPPAGDPQGTLQYLAPEQVGRVKRGSDARSDLYSLGATLYEMLTGSPPFALSDPVEIVHAHLARVPLSPAIVNPGAPRALSEIVLKLLAKTPEWRYQTAEGLLADLLEAEEHWKSTGIIPPFELGRRDLARQLPLSMRLYGRERECASLAEAFRRIEGGGREVFVIAGAAGVGKTALAAELRRLVATRGMLLSGKCDPQGGAPLAPVIDAFGDLLRGILSEPAETLAAWRRRLQVAVGANGRVLTDVLPELREIIGEQAAVAALDPVENANRLHLVVSRFLRACSEPDRPVALFLDDLQWADAATFELIRVLVANPEVHHLLVVVALRNDERSGERALSGLLRDLRDHAIPVSTIELRPLGREAISAMLADALRMPLERVAPLAQSIFEKTQGSPLFVVRLLRLLQVSRLLVYRTETDTWTWDLPRIAELPVSDNVVDLLIGAIRGLPARAARALEVAACIGANVDVALLAAVCDWSIDETAQVLTAPIQEGLLIPIWTDRAAYRFAHDRVRQAAYSLLPEEERRALHRRIGRQLASGAREGVGQSLCFQIADQLNLGAAVVTEASERLELAQVNLRAGRKARARAAHETALRYFQRGLEVLPEASWRAADELWFSLHRDAVECAYLARRYALGDALMNEALILASPLDKATLCDVRVVACTMRGALDEALRWGREGLRALDTDLPALADLAAERRAVEEKLAAQSPASILELPPMKDPRDLVTMKLLANVGLVAWFVGDPDLWVLAVLRRTLFALEHGNSPYSPVGYAVYAMLRTHYDDYAGAETFSKLGIELGERIGSAAATVRPTLYHAAFVNHWRAPLQTSERQLKQGFDLALECGDFAFASYVRGFGAMTAFSLGLPLVRVLGDAEDGLAFCLRVGHKAMVDYTLVYRQAVRALQGLTRGCRFDDVEFSERDFLDNAKRNPTGVFLFRALRMQVAYLLGEIEEARQMLRLIDKMVHLRFGFVAEVDQCFYAVLTLAALADRTPSEKASLVVEMKSHAGRLSLWAESCPVNFAHKHAMVVAEIARVEGRDADAARLFDHAIESAARAGFMHDEALAYELGGRFCLQRGATRVAGLYLGAALDVYASWGASAKVVTLQKEMAAQKIHVGPRAPMNAPGEELSLDLRSLLKAAETLSAEVVFDRLLEKLMKTCIQAAGAERAVLVVEESDAPVVRAVGTASGDVVLEHVPLSRASNVPLMPIEHVRRSGEVVVLTDAVNLGRFVADPDVQERGVRSVLAVPLERHGQRVGVLYLENNLAAGVFGQERVHVFELLSAQIAVSLENSRLFEKLQGEIAQRTYAEGKVGFLSAAGAALAETLAYEPTLARVARLAVPFLADWCLVDVVEDGKVHRMASAHVDPQKNALLARLQESYPPHQDAPTPPALALRTGEPQLFSQLTNAQLEGMCRDAEHVRIVEELGVRTVMALPLVAHGRTLGAITFASGRRGRVYGPDDLDFAKELARRAALAIDNARLYTQVTDAVRVRDEFLSVASHELRTPITSLQLATEGLLRGAIAVTPDNVERTFRNAHRQIVRLSQLIDELLTVSSIEAGHLVLNIEEVDLRSVVTETLEIFAEAIARAGGGVDLRPGPAILGQWDRRKLEQVVTNLLANALKFGEGKGIEIVLEERPGAARLVVTDHGIGIAKERVPHVFERYERAVSAKQYGGLGLGLFIVRVIVEALGGTVRVDTVEGSGATFTVELPLSAAHGGRR